jgi:Lipase C-terminal domain/Palmitoyl protein thioesterase
VHPEFFTELEWHTGIDPAAPRHLEWDMRRRAGLSIGRGVVINRRSFLGGVAAVSALPLRPAQAQFSGEIPILFVHGNGDQAPIWLTTIWRFETNGYRRELLHAVNFSDPLARDVDAVAQPNRSSIDDQLLELSEAIDRMKAATGASRLALIGLSRGGNAIRNYVSAPERAANVTQAILGGTPNHGVFDWEATRGNEFNGRGPFLSRLNGGESEVVPGPAFLTLRSDGQDKYAQPDGRVLGQPGVPTGVTAEGPALKGATNLVLGSVDHRETATSPRAFREMYKFITGAEPARLAIFPETRVTLNGKVTGFPAGVPTNRPVKGARVQVFAVSPETGERLGDALWVKETKEDGVWGALTTTPDTYLEFVIAAPDHPVTHIYMAPFPRSSDIVHLRPARPLGKGDEGAEAVVLMSRPRGYFGIPRDVVILDGREPADVKSGVPTDSVTTLRLASFADRPIVGEFNLERVVARPWPARENHICIIELMS